MLLACGCALCEASEGPICTGCVEQFRPAGPLPPTDPPNRALVRYEGLGRELVTTVKYRNGRRLVGPLGALLADLAGDVPADAVTWVPASPAGRRERGYDQGRCLARAMARCARLRLLPLLRRAPGPAQTGRPAVERHLGPRLTARRSGSGRVVLVDDVITTGTTLEVATAALRGAGWHPVLGVAVAATPRRGRSGPRGSSRDGAGVARQ